MRIHYLIFTLSILAAACNNETAQTESDTTETTGEKTKEGKSKPGGFWQKLVMHEIKDGKGTVTAVMPAPESWTLTRTGISGPNGMTVKDMGFKSFMDNYNPQLEQSYSQTPQRSFPGIDQLIQEDFIPAMNGMEFVKVYEIPEISRLDNWYSDQLYAAMPANSTVKAFGSDWKKSNGDSYFLLIHVNVKTSQAMQNWWYFSSGLEAPQADFEKAKKQYIFALANMRYNLEPIAEYNRAEMQRCGANWKAFNDRMAANQAAFDAQQRAFVNKSDAINESIMASWKANNASSDKQQEERIDNIYERTNVQSTETGKMYKVQEGANNYWMNRDGEYIGTKLQGYDPNLDDNMNEQKWDELKRVQK